LPKKHQLIHWKGKSIANFVEGILDDHEHSFNLGKVENFEGILHPIRKI
jgi:hypothetical protein